ncbi:MAG: ComEC/Rec2 family competence protein [Labilithrix sp.]|nr:ComEC/Rec2 family competence protein [Labilithrix sp.]
MTLRRACESVEAATVRVPRPRLERSLRLSTLPTDPQRLARVGGRPPAASLQGLRRRRGARRASPPSRSRPGWPVGRPRGGPGQGGDAPDPRKIERASLDRTLHSCGVVTVDAATKGARQDPILWLSFASCAGPLALVSPWSTLATAGIVAAVLARAGARGLAVAAALALAVGVARGDRAIARYEQARRATIDAGSWPARCTGRGVVSRSPVAVGGAVRVEIEADELYCNEGSPLRGRVTLHVPRDEADPDLELARGDTVAVLASLAPPYRFWNDGAGDPRPLSARRGAVLSGGAEDVVVERVGSGLMGAIDRARAHVRRRIVATFPAETSPMARALVLGEDDLPADDQRAFRRSGLAHLLAVSGMHLVLVVMGIVAALRALLVRVPAVAARFDAARIAAGVGLPVAWIYAEIAGGSGSAVRAAWMCTVALLARALGRRTAPWRALGLSVLAMSAVDPLVAFDVSFVLSALATGGLVALARPIEAAMSKHLCVRGRTLPVFVARPLATTAAATIACAPVLATMAPELPLSGLLANVVAVPLGEAAALPLCLVHALLVGWPAAESGCAAAASGALLLVRMVARAFTWGALPVPAPTAAELAVFAASAAGLALGRRGDAPREPGPPAVAPRRRYGLVALGRDHGALGWLRVALGGLRVAFGGLRAALGRPGVVLGLGATALVLLEIVARARGAPRGVLRVTFLDVGQGDSAVVDLPDGSAMLVDGGGLVGSPIDVGERAVASVLAARRRSRLAAVVLSHPHPDHYLGLASGLARVRVDSFWDTGQGEDEGAAGAYADLLTDLRRRGASVLRPADLCGARTIGGVIVEVLAPCPGLVTDRGANDNSFVLRVRFGERAILFTGDAEHDAEAELVERLGARGGLRADVLKVGHHGSRTSTTAPFVAAVDPGVAVISCGVRNRFGHPHPSTLATLADAKVRVLRTDRVGSVVVTTDGRSLDVRTAADE